jgi:hypothetical protein
MLMIHGMQAKKWTRKWRKLELVLLNTDWRITWHSDLSDKAASINTYTYYAIKNAKNHKKIARVVGQHSWTF